MNRRALFSFLGTAPLGAAVALTLTPEPKRPVLIANEHKCAGCGCSHFHYVPKVQRHYVHDISGRHVISDTSYYCGFDVKCLWCQELWTGPVPEDTVL